MFRTCRCLITDWRGLRLALGITQQQEADLLGVGVRTVKRVEGEPHHCAGGAMTRLMLAFLQDEAYRRRLAAARYPLPPACRQADSGGPQENLVLLATL